MAVNKPYLPQDIIHPLAKEKVNLSKALIHVAIRDHHFCSIRRLDLFSGEALRQTVAIKNQV
jgi:hypothetical protein